VVSDLLAQSLHDETLRAPLASYYRLASSQVEEHLRVNAEALGLRPKVSPKIIPRLMNALLDGLLMQRIVDPEAVKDEDVMQVLETLAGSLFDIVPPVIPTTPTTPTTTVTPAAPATRTGKPG
jgi:hypothetical protein